jgi:ligand-binding sensor protein
MYLTNIGRPGTVSAISTKIPICESDRQTYTETELYHKINRENGLAFSRSEKPLIHSLKEWKKPCYDDK